MTKLFAVAAAALLCIPAPGQSDDQPQPPKPVEETPQAEDEAPTTGEATANKIDFRKQVLPILEKNCVECHKAPFTDENGKKKRPKGGVMLDTADAIQKGKRGKLLVPKKPKDSLLHAVVTLPDDDEDRMPPPKKGGPLPKAQIEILRQWIEEGADFGGWTGGPEKAGEPKADGAKKPADGKPNEEPKQDGPKKDGPGKDGEPDLLALARDLDQLPPEQLAELRKFASVAEPVQPGSPLLRVAFYGREPDTDDAALAQLTPYAAHIAELSLCRTRITDAAMAALASMPRLWRLDLARTAITDQGIAAMANSRSLAWLNLYETEVGDDGLASLAACSSLRSVFVWQTPASAEAVVALRQRLPAARVVFAADLPEPMAAEAPGRVRRR